MDRERQVLREVGYAEASAQPRQGVAEPPGTGSENAHVKDGAGAAAGYEGGFSFTVVLR